MEIHRLGQRKVVLPKRPFVASGAAIAVKKEGEGPLGSEFDAVIEDDLFDEETWEKAESRFAYTAATTCLTKAGCTSGRVEAVLGGDLINQIIPTSMAARELHAPFLGLYGACSTMAEGLCVAAMLVDGGYVRNALCVAGSHFCSAERQYRFPLEYGSQRTPTSQWTVTGAGAVFLTLEDGFPRLARITHLTVGQVVDLGVKDANNMGAAMAPAAADTLTRHLQDLHRTAADYDLIVTGDLGRLGHEVVTDLFTRDGVDMTKNYKDCGLLLYDLERQDMHMGGSGCGCSAAVLNGYLLRGMREGKWNRIVFAPTGALLSPTSSWQGESIPGICHAVAITAEGR